MAIIRKPPPKRLISFPVKGPQTQKEAQEKYFIKLVMMHPRYRLIIASLKEGVKATVIAAHFGQNGWLTVNERTFTEAIRVFKIKHPDAIDNLDFEGIDKFADPNRPPVDIKTQLQQLLRLQRIRLALDVKQEQENGRLFSSTVKEIEQMRLLAETLAKIDGVISDSGRGAQIDDSDVKENLSNIKKDQITRDRLHAGVKQLVEAKT